MTSYFRAEHQTRPEAVCPSQDREVPYWPYTAGLRNCLLSLEQKQENWDCWTQLVGRCSVSVYSCCCYCCWVISVVSDPVQCRRRRPTRLPRPWDSQGKNTGVGCHFLLQCMKVKSESEVAQSCPTQRPQGLQPTRLLRPWDFSRQEFTLRVVY